jgi:hypothetical protein
VIRGGGVVIEWPNEWWIDLSSARVTLICDTRRAASSGSGIGGTVAIVAMADGRSVGVRQLVS